MRDSDSSDNNSIQFSEYSSTKNEIEESVVIEKQTQTIQKKDNEEINLTNVNSSIFSINQSMDIKEKEKEKAPQKKNFKEKSALKNNEYKSQNKGNRITYIYPEPIKGNKISVIIDKEKSAYKNHSVYEISKDIDNNKHILCYRRYDNFDVFYSALKIRFPHYIYPRLPPKNIMTKVYDNKTFLEQRRKQLEFFINEISFHSNIGKSEEIKKFLNGANFDDKYFKSLLPLFDYPETSKKIKNSNNIVTATIKGASYLYKYFTGIKGQNNESENSKKIWDIIKNLDKKIEKYNKAFEEIKNIYNSLIEENKEKKFMMNNLLFLKNEESTIQNNIDKKKFNDLIELSQKYDFERSELLLKNFEQNIVNTLDYCILYLYGEQDAIERYIEFLEKYKEIINYKKQENDDKRIYIEQENIKRDIDRYESKLLEEIYKIENRTEGEFEMAIHSLIVSFKDSSEQFVDLFQNSNFINE